MAEGDKPDPRRTVDGRAGPAASPPEPEPVLGTMQMPHGGVVSPEQPELSRPPAMPDAAPLHSTVMPSSPSGAVLAVAPPAMPKARYKLELEIARGGMGRVVEAKDTLLGRTVALKEVLAMDSDTLRRFQREIRITARLEHPAIVPVHDAGTSASGAPYYVMRKVGGRALEELVASADTVPKRLALVPHVVAAANAIAHAHERGIVHRDIKPANILVGDLGETVVIDWGLAKAIGEADDASDPQQRRIGPGDDGADDSIKTRAGIVFGTPGFMAPEQLRGKPVDERCDVYALGATLYHLIARRPPHHNKNGDAMMRAAVDGPPVPLTELVPEIPPELATIVDKALAHDVRRRYQDARQLAEELQAFLTGKLVGAHQYTAREKFHRFVRQNKGAVTIGSIALVAGLIGTVFAFVRITDERDRADDQAQLAIQEKRAADAQRDEVIKTARELTLANARHASTTEPTRALAMIKPLVKSEWWRAARDVGAAARAHGVAFSIPLSKHTLTLELSRDGQRALAAGDDGKVRIVDIVKRTARELINTGGAVGARFADGERLIVLYQGNRITIIDAATNAKREITTPTAVEKLEISGPLAYWVDPADTAWRLDLAGGPAMKVELGEPVTSVAPSPDGRWIAFGGTQHLLLADRSDPTLPPEIKSEGVVHMLTWSADSKHLAVHIDDEVLDLNMQPVPQIWNRYRVGKRYGLAFSGGRVFSAGPLGVGQLFGAGDGGKVRVNDPNHTLGVYEGRERVVISAKPQGEIVVLSDYGDRSLRAPLPIELVATSARGEWIVAAAEGMLLVWNLEQFEPRSFASHPPSSARFVGSDAMIVTYETVAAEWIDLRSGKATALGDLPALETVIAAPDGAEAIAIDVTHRGWRVAGIGQPQALPGEVNAAAYVDNTRLVLAVEAGLQLEDLQKGTKTLLVAHKPAIRDLAVTATDGGWVVGTFDDGLVWRTHLAGPPGGTKLPLPAPLPAHLPVAMGPAGTVLLGVGTELRAWRADGKVETLVTVDKPIFDLVTLSPDRVLALAIDGTGHVVDLRGRQVTAHLPISTQASPASDGGLLAGPTTIGGVEVIDPTVGWRWPLATPEKGFQQPFSYVEIARDGSRVLAVTGQAVVMWSLDLPKTADETAQWLDKTTNATAESPSGPLTWRQ